MKYDAAKSPFVVVVPCVARCSLLCFAVLCVARHAVSTTMRPTTQNTQHQGPRASALARGGTESSYVSVCSCGSAWFGVGFLMGLRACDFPTERALSRAPFKFYSRVRKKKHEKHLACHPTRLCFSHISGELRRARRAQRQRRRAGLYKKNASAAAGSAAPSPPADDVTAGRSMLCPRFASLTA